MENTNSGDTGHVVLGVLGGIALVFFVVLIVVPIMRWRQRRVSSRSTSSRASSRRTHDRVGSAEAHAQAPLLESQTVDPDNRAPVMSEKGKGKEIFGSSMMEVPKSWKILEKIPEFDDSSDSLSSLGKPIALGEQSFAPTDKAQPERPTILHITAASSSSIQPSHPDLEPHRQETGAPQQSQTATLVNKSSSDAQLPTSPTSPTQPLTNAFQRALSLNSPNSPSAASPSTSGSMFRYPSVAVSEASRSTAPSAGSRSPDPNVPSTSEVPPSRPQQLNLSMLTRAPTWHQNTQALSSGPNVHLTPAASKTPDARFRKEPMPSIPESLRSGFSATFPKVNTIPPTPPPPVQPVAKLRELVQGSVLNAVRHSRGFSSDTGVSFAASFDLTRSNTSRTQRTSESAADQEPPGSALTHNTFGRPGPPITSPEFYRPPSAQPHLPAQQPIAGTSTVPFPVQPSPAVTPGSATGYILYETDGRNALQSRFSTDSETTSNPIATAPTSDEDARRRTMSFPREPSPPLIPAPLSHPPLPPLLRHTGPPRALPTLPPHLTSSSEPGPVLPAGPSNLDHGLTEGDDEAPPSPSDSTESLIPRIPTPQLTLGLRPISPFRFDFGLGSDSRSGTPVPGSSQLSRRSTQKSKASSLPGSLKISKRSRSRSKSREREGSSSASGSKGRGSRRVTFGVAPPSPDPSSGGGSRPPSRAGSVNVTSPPETSIRPLPPVPPVPPVPPLPASVSGRPTEVPYPPPSAFLTHPTSQHTSARTSLTNDTSAGQDGHDGT